MQQRAVRLDEVGSRLERHPHRGNLQNKVMATAVDVLLPHAVEEILERIMDISRARHFQLTDKADSGCACWTHRERDLRRDHAQSSGPLCVVCHAGGP